jgi:hypothetical protein
MGHLLPPPRERLNTFGDGFAGSEPSQHRFATTEFAQSHQFRALT